MIWCSWNWEAIATIIAAIITVGAALIVARLQMRISGTQNKILQSQAEIQRSANRAELFDRRFAVYQTTIDYAEAYFAVPHITPADLRKKLDALLPKWKKARHQAKFLFNEDIRRELDDIVMAAGGLEDLWGPNVTWDSPIGQDFRNRSAAISQQIQGLADSMGDQMRLFASE